jgi:hypothetical protein
VTSVTTRFENHTSNARDGYRIVPGFSHEAPYIDAASGPHAGGVVFHPIGWISPMTRRFRAVSLRSRFFGSRSRY